MSFDEFFLGKKSEVKEQPARSVEGADSSGTDIDGSRFVSGRPKLNIRSATVVLFVPRYEGGRGARYDVSIEQDGRAIGAGRLKSSPLNSDTTSIPTEIDLMALGVDPLRRLVLVIDGVKAFEGFERTYVMFNADGIPISRAENTTIVLRRKDSFLWFNDSKLATSKELGSFIVDTVEVAPGGYVRVRDRPQFKEKEDKASKISEAPKAAKPCIAKPKASISMPLPESAAGVVVGSDVLPLYSQTPDIGLDINGDGADDCLIRVDSPGRTDDVPGTSFGRKALEGAKGDVTVSVVFEGAVLASSRFFVIPGFSCSYNGKGDIPSGTELEFDLGDGPIVRSFRDEDLAGPYDCAVGQVTMSWNIPIATIDLGSGPVPLEMSEMNVDDLPDSIVVTVKGAAKKSVFLGSGGKKVNLTPDWVDETVRINATVVANAVFASPSREVALFITVNSCPVRQFLSVRNDPGMEVSFSDGAVRASITGNAEYVCRVFGVGRAVHEQVLSRGENVISVDSSAISAEVVETRSGKVLATETIQVRDLPFLVRDDMGDVWLYVSKERRIPIPDALLANKDNAAEVRKWHSQIVRMNPELRSISPEKTVKAFKEFEKA